MTLERGWALLWLHQPTLSVPPSLPDLFSPRGIVQLGWSGGMRAAQRLFRPFCSGSLGEAELDPLQTSLFPVCNNFSCVGQDKEPLPAAWGPPKEQPLLALCAIRGFSSSGGKAVSQGGWFRLGWSQGPGNVGENPEGSSGSPVPSSSF